ncbi:hypothetical protein AGR4A_pAt30193 [Agrobacterium tumefaciens str. B6]|uniref:Uncharacterized protein n=1 Tax=Agrobacterium tumefaciens str. B6 TaxID=1183423 RepID=A0A822V9U6_AGRTU|nr:hypothetical protein AGR4A_pAt30193 [Agrobacterium tumefaciens str. B6]
MAPTLATKPPTNGPKTTTPKEGIVTSQLAPFEIPIASAMAGNPGTITHPTMIVKQATLSNVNEPIGFSVRII